MGGPKALSQLQAVRIFERKLKKIKLESVPMKALQAQHKSADPLQKTFGALMLAYSKRDVVRHAATLAKKYNISLRSVSDDAHQTSGSRSKRRRK
jgi:methionine-rich copper-binding protein CopC